MERKITDQTKAIQVVHMHGNPADMIPIMKIAKKYDIDPSRVVCGAGSDEIIALLCQGFADIDDDFISQSHARIFEKADEIVVEDLGSTNGTYLNKQRVSSPMVVSLGDWLQLGDTVMELK